MISDHTLFNCPTWIRTRKCGNQNPVPCRLAIGQHLNKRRYSGMGIEPIIKRLKFFCLILLAIQKKLLCISLKDLSQTCTEVYRVAADMPFLLD